MTENERAELAYEARRFRHFANKLLSELAEVKPSDVEGRRLVLYAIAGFLRPTLTATRGITESRKLGIIAHCADVFVRLKFALENSPSEPATARQDAISVLQELEACFGFELCFDRPALGLCYRLAAALKFDNDEEFLVKFRRIALELCGRELDPYVAQVLLGMQVRSGHNRPMEIELPADLKNLAGKPEEEIIRAIISRAQELKLQDEESWRGSAVRLTTGHDTDGKPIKRYAESLDAEIKPGLTLRDFLPDITRDPIEFLYSSRQPVKLEELAAMGAELAGDERWKQLAQANLTPDEYRYVRFHLGAGMTQAEVGEHLNWDPCKLAAVRRNADLKLKKSGLRGNRKN